MHYACLLSTASLIALEELAGAEWTAVELLSPVQRFPARVKTGRVRVRCEIDFVIMAEPVQVDFKVEIFRLQARKGDFPSDKRFSRTEYVDSDELCSAFIGLGHTLYVGGRRLRSAGRETTILVEDYVLVRDASGQRLYIAADDENPGGLVICRRSGDLPNSTARTERLRLV